MLENESGALYEAFYISNSAGAHDLYEKIKRRSSSKIEKLNRGFNRATKAKNQKLNLTLSLPNFTWTSKPTLERKQITEA